MHVPGKCSRPAIAAELGRCDAIGGKIGTQAAFLARDADSQPALRMHVTKVLDRETCRAIVLSCARREHAAAEPASLVDEARLKRGKAESIRSKNRRLRIMAIEGIVHPKASETGRHAESRLHRSHLC